jgi:hypothetical protein
MKETKKWIILSIVLVFITGVLAGTLVGIITGRKMAFPPERAPFHGAPMDRSMPPEQLREGFVQRLTNDLSLTTMQVRELRKIMDANEKQLMTFRDETRGKMRTMRRNMSSQIKDILNDQQKKKFDEFEKRMDRQFEKDEFEPSGERHGGGFGPPDPPGFRGQFDRSKDRESDRPGKP